MRLRSILIPAIVLGVVVAGCDSDDKPTTGDSLTITLEDLTLSPPRVESWLLECGPAGGSLPDPEGACERLMARSEPFAAPPADEVCTQISGGPESLTITGSVDAKVVKRTFSKANGCEIDRFDQIVATLGIAELIG